MKNEMSLDGYGVTEMSIHEKRSVEGGSFLKIWDNFVEFLVDVVVGAVVVGIVKEIFK